jgi:uncharacterized repeat protein (TIGR01451 family)
MNGLVWKLAGRFALGLALSQIFAGGSLSAQPSDLKVSLQAHRVVLNEGKETLAPAEKAKPGDIIQYDASYQNNGTAAVKNVGAVVPIPAGLTLVSDSAKPAAPEASLDGKTFSAAPLTRPVKNEAGVMENEPVPLSEYRALRWNLAEVAPGSSTTVTVRARVGTNGSSK